MLLCIRITQGPCQNADSDSVALDRDLSFCVSKLPGDLLLLLLLLAHRISTLGLARLPVHPNTKAVMETPTLLVFPPWLESRHGIYLL